MIKKVNPRVAMFEALMITDEILTTELQKLRVFIDRNFSGKIYVSPVDPIDGGWVAEFRFNIEHYSVRSGQVLVKSRKDSGFTVLTPDQFAQLYHEYPNPETAELKRLADFILNYFPCETSEGGSAVDAAIRLIEKGAQASKVLQQIESSVPRYTGGGGNYTGSMDRMAAVACPVCGLCTASATGFPAPHDCRPKGAALAGTALNCSDNSSNQNPTI